MVLALGEVEVRLVSSRDETRPPQARGHLVGAQARRVGRHRSSRGVVALAEDRRHHHEVARRVRARSPARPRSSDGSGDVVAQDVLELDRLRGRRDVIGRDRGQDRVLVEDVVELALEAGELVVGQPEAGEMGDVLDIGARQGGHAPDDSRERMPTRACARCGPPTSTRRWPPSSPTPPPPVGVATERERQRPRRTTTGGGRRDGVTVNGPVAGWEMWGVRSHRRHGLGTALTEAIIAG